MVVPAATYTHPQKPICSHVHSRGGVGLTDEKTDALPFPGLHLLRELGVKPVIGGEARYAEDRGLLEPPKHTQRGERERDVGVGGGWWL